MYRRATNPRIYIRRLDEDKIVAFRGADPPRTDPQVGGGHAHPTRSRHAGSDIEKHHQTRNHEFHSQLLKGTYIQFSRLSKFYPLKQMTICLTNDLFAAMCDTRTDAGAHVQTQSVRVESARLPKNDAVPKVAEDGCPAG